MSKPEWSKSGWVSVIITIIIATSGVMVQWGVITTKLDQMEKRLDAFLFEAKSLREEYVVLGRRVARLEGQFFRSGAIDQ